ncbi:hypothetical protein WN944_010673 [Citrus x changshan-huyou]|uniref:Uncharacterized protein n=1 Tax=Citrus x changshan-huyou TaxID=2935761 RepID=A0AAP0R0V1_9ROSI
MGESEGIYARHVLYIVSRGLGAIPLNRTDENLTPREIEQKAAELADFLRGGDGAIEVLRIQEKVTARRAVYHYDRCQVEDRWGDSALPLGTVGSVRPTFVPARWVGLAVKLPSAFALEGQSPSGPRKPLHASVTFWYRSRGPHRNSTLPLDVQSTAAPQRISGRTS